MTQKFIVTRGEREKSRYGGKKEKSRRERKRQRDRERDGERECYTNTRTRLIGARHHTLETRHTARRKDGARKLSFYSERQKIRLFARIPK